MTSVIEGSFEEIEMGNSIEVGDHKIIYYKGPLPNGSIFIEIQCTMCGGGGKEILDDQEPSTGRAVMKYMIYEVMQHCLSRQAGVPQKLLSRRR